jgi:dTDP-L-rhamnose 4-epimerase
VDSVAGSVRVVRVLVTGAAGFIGSHVTDVLAERGHELVLVDALLPVAHPAEREVASAPKGLVHAALQDPGVLPGLLRDVDVVCHQAAMVGHGVDPGDAPAFANHNDYATACLLKAMYEGGVRRLVLASSMVVYGEGTYRCAAHGVVRPGPRTAEELAAGRYDPPCPRCGHGLTSELTEENSVLDPRSLYAASKLAQENYAAAWARQSGSAVWALRYHNVYGPRMPRNTPYAGVASLFRSALARGEAPRVLEDGRQRRDFVHVRDVALANALAVECEPPRPFEAVNVCSGQPHTIGELAEVLATSSSGPPPVTVGGARPGDVRHIVADPSRARRLLGFRAQTGFDEGVRAFAADPLRDTASVRNR